MSQKLPHPLSAPPSADARGHMSPDPSPAATVIIYLPRVVKLQYNKRTITNVIESVVCATVFKDKATADLSK